jgi:acetolactate synthase small subunit
MLTLVVDNEAGILAKIAGLFTARGYNIDSLTVSEITGDHRSSRITIVTHGPPAVIDQIRPARPPGAGAQGGRPDRGGPMWSASWR